MKLEQIEEMWEKDCQIDMTNLSSEARNIPQLHAKYYKIYIREKMLLRKQHADYKKLKLQKYEFLINPTEEDVKDKMIDALDSLEEYNGFIPAVVIKADPKYVQAFTKKGETIDIKNDGLALIQKTLSDKDPKNRKVKSGSIIRVIQKNKQWEVVQLPKVEASLVSMDPQTGAIKIGRAHV